MKNLLYSVLYIVIVLIASATPTQAQAPQTYLATANITSIQPTGQNNQQNNASIRKVRLRFTSGALKGMTRTLIDGDIAVPNPITYQVGDSVVVTISDDLHGHTSMYISDFDRRYSLVILLIIFLVAVIAIARRQGVTSLIGMLISLYVILRIIIPSILEGTNAFTITIIGTLIIIPATYYPAHGLNRKTTMAVIGTFITLFFVALMSYVFTLIGHLTGFASEEAVFIQGSYGSTINILNLLLAGMLIGALAVLNDITIAQASTVASLHRSNSRLNTRELYNHAMDVGRDHVASLVNTLILVYIGASLPLVLLFYNNHTPIGLIFNQEIVATEIIRTLIASVGIILAVPITTYISCKWID